MPSDYDYFRPRSEPARTLYDALHTEVQLRPEKASEAWIVGERMAVWRAACDYAQQHGLVVPSLAEVEASEQHAMGHVDYVAQFAYDLAAKMMPTHAERCQRESTRDVVFLLQWHPSKRSTAWITESVWLDRDEATAFAKAHKYNYVNGWRVYGVPSYGALATLLKSQDTILTTNPWSPVP